MSEPLSEAAGCALLARLFRARGYTIRRNVRFDENGVSFDIDGWDAAARVGFEFLSSEQEDHDDLSLREFERLKDAEQRGELFVFVVDEVEPLSAAALRAAADAFLDEVAARTSSRRGKGKKPAARRSGAAGKKPPPVPRRTRAAQSATELASTSRRPAGKKPRKAAAPAKRTVKKAARKKAARGATKAKPTKPAKRTTRQRGS